MSTTLATSWGDSGKYQTLVGPFTFSCPIIDPPDSGTVGHGFRLVQGRASPYRLDGRTRGPHYLRIPRSFLFVFLHLLLVLRPTR
jgi:hypothetical protein